jgi:hypothetical protein
MSKRHERASILDGMRDAWEIVPDLSFGMLVNYVFEGEDVTQVGDEELAVYLNDFIRNNM